MNYCSAVTVTNDMKPVKKRMREGRSAQGRAAPPVETTPAQRDAGFQTYCVADLLVGGIFELFGICGLEIRDTAGLETCATM
jgi:hypothetical protein